MYLEYYKKLLGNVPRFLNKYLDVPCLERLKGIGYFCGMDYASKSVYDFREFITRYDHSLTVALLTYKLTHDKKATIAGLFHDVATPCFSHVVDYMNKDFEKQESTEEYTEEILRGDKVLLECLKKDKINIDEITDFKKYSIVDLDRPSLCADRLDGVILTGISWSRNITLDEIKSIISDLDVYKNSDGYLEIGFKSRDICNLVLNINKEIDRLCHSNHDNYMMVLLGDITRRGIELNLFSYIDLFYKREDDLFRILNRSRDKYLKEKLSLFYNIDIKDIPDTLIPNVKRRVIKPLVLGERI